MRNGSFVCGCLLALVSISSSTSVAQITQVDIPKAHVIRLSEQSSGKEPFVFVSTPNGEILTLVARDDGVWELHRTRNWNSSTPKNDTLAMPGFFSRHDKKDLETLAANLFVTADSSYAICIGSAFWLKRKNGRAAGRPKTDNIINVVDLTKFEVVGTARTFPMNLLPFTSVWLAPDGKLAVTSLSDGLQRRGELVRLAIPQLVAGNKCTYDWIADKNSREIPISTSDQECKDDTSPSTLQEFLQAEPGASFSHEHSLISSVCKGVNAEFCRTPGKLTKDGQFGVSESTEGHDNFFGSWVFTKRSFIVFSASKRSEIGRIVEPPYISTRTILAERNGRNYFIILEHGSQLNIYELKD